MLQRLLSTVLLEHLFPSVCRDYKPTGVDICAML